MNKSDQIGELAKALALAQGSIKGAVKDGQNTFFSRDGKGGHYATLASVWEACREHLSKNGLAVTSGGTYLADAGWCLETMLTHSSGQFISYLFPLKPSKEDPQGYKSANTYALRIGLESIVGVPAEDDDGNAASGKPAVNTQAAANYVAKEKIADMQRQPVGEKLDNLKAEMDAKKVDANPEVNPFSGDKYDTRTISVPQGKRLYAIAKGAGWTDDELKKALMDGWKIEHSKDIKAGKQYEEICEFFKQGGKPPAQAEAEPEDPFELIDDGDAHEGRGPF